MGVIAVMAQETRRTEAAVDTVVAACAASLALVAPVIGAAASTAVPAISAGLKAALGRVARRREVRAATVLDAAANEAGLSVEALLGRLEADPQREELLLRTLTAARETASVDKLVALALALANGATAADEDVTWERTFVGVLADLDASHVELLRRFTRTLTELGMGTGHDLDQTPAQLNQTQILASDIPNLPYAVASLQKGGLIQGQASGGGAMLGGGGAATRWEATEFGHQVVNRLTEIGELLASRGAAGPAEGAYQHGC
jgi:uncharacterized membrane protein YgcG